MSYRCDSCGRTFKETAPFETTGEQCKACDAVDAPTTALEERTLIILWLKAGAKGSKGTLPIELAGHLEAGKHWDWAAEHGESEDEVEEPA